MAEEKCFCHLNGFAVKDAAAREHLNKLGHDVEKLGENVENLEKKVDNINPVVSWNDLTDKPFEEKKIVDITVDHSTVDKIISIAFGDTTLIHVANETPSKNDIIGSTVTLTIADNTFTAIFTDTALIFESDEMVMFSLDGLYLAVFYVTGAIHTEMGSITFDFPDVPKTGLYVPAELIDEADFSSITKTTVQQIDPIFIPDTEKPVQIDISNLESNGTIVELYADGTTKTTTLEFDTNGNPIKITDADGHETVLEW